MTDKYHNVVVYIPVLGYKKRAGRNCQPLVLFNGYFIRRILL